MRLPLPSIVGLGLLALPTTHALAMDAPTVTVGAGLRTSFTDTNVSGTSNDPADFALESARIYIGGKVTDQIGFMFNTEYNGSSLDVIDAAATMSFSDAFNIWAGRFLPPSDRANLYGPYYANNWGVFQDGVQDGYPFSTTGRDEGLMYWGQYGKTKLSLGAFDVKGLTSGNARAGDVLYAGRVQFDFWDPEAGYYLNGSYYGAKDLLALGFAAQTVGGDDAYTVDLLLEKKLGNGGVVTLEGEYAKYDNLGGYGIAPESDGWYGLVAYLFPAQVGIGKFQILGKYGTSTHERSGGDVEWDTLEVNLNYIIKQFNARLMMFYKDTRFDAVRPDFKQFGVAVQIQM